MLPAILENLLSFRKVGIRAGGNAKFAVGGVLASIEI